MYNCIPHMKRPSVRNCRTCGGPICQECATNYDGQCIECEKKNIAAYRKNFQDPITYLIAAVIIVVFVLVAGVIGLGLPPVDQIPGILLGSILLIIGFATFPYGWRGLSMITSKFFLILPIIGWVIYFVVKGLAAFYLGWAFAAYKLIPIYLHKKNYDALEKFILEDEKID